MSIEEKTVGTVNSDFATSAAKGAALARQEQEAKLADKQKEAAELALARENIKPLHDAIKSLSHIKGVKVSFSVVEGRSDAACGLTVGRFRNKGRYGVIVTDSKSAYSMYRDDDMSHDNFKGASFKDKTTLTDVLQSIALITGFHYPDKAAEIDKVINDAVNKAKNPVAAQPSRTLAQKLHLR